MKAHYSRLVIVLVSLCSCVSAKPVAPNPIIKPSDVTRDAGVLKGKIVSISGYLILGDEAHAFWNSKADADEVVQRGASGGDPIWNRCIAIYFNRKIARSLRIPTRGNIEVRGKVGVTDRKKDGVDLWACNDVYVTVDRLVRK